MKQFSKLQMPIKHVQKSLAGINEKTCFNMNFSLIVTQMKKTKITLFCVNFFLLSLIYFG